MPAPSEVLELIARFEQQLADYKSGRYNETQLRRDFLDPFFKALGWDIDNTSGYAETYRDVIHEDAVRIGGVTKAPDYGFRIGGNRKFFLEAKKPSVAIRDEIPPAYQLRRYAWNAKLPLSILSDFEEFAVYDGRIKPGKSDPASTARIFYCTFREYADKWDWIASIFSREAILKGSFDRYAETNKAKRGTAEVDADFLATIEGWRTDLANNLALRNAKLEQRELNFAVQRILDRIIFLRICEDRGIEDYGRLLALANGPRIYPRLCQLFHAADARYNSGLFHFKPEKGRDEPPDELTLDLEIDDKLLRDLFKGLYYPDSPYEFRILSADILGQVYEQFLGKVIRLTPGHRAVVEDKPEVKKAGGVYYTPTYIVDYIVRQTVGRLVEGKTPKQIEKITILDPACGSGSFLIGAYQFLLDWHLGFYIKDDPDRWAKGKRPVLVQTTQGWRLTIDERKRILLAHIYGVDIDAQAVEVTKLSLLLKVLEGETGQSLQPIFSVFHERALPDLGKNIKCGNSLVGPDFYQQAELPLLTDDERYRINAFDWRSEFSDIFRRGGFDIVIGNPPYIRIQTMKDAQPQEAIYFSVKYESASEGNYDIYVVFIDCGLKLLNRTGKLGFIAPNKFLNARYGRPLRKLLSKEKHLEQIVHFGDQQVFSNATTYTCLLFLSKHACRSCDVAKVGDLVKWKHSGVAVRERVPASVFSLDEWNLDIGPSGALRNRLRKCGVPLGNVAHLFVGLQTSADKIFVLKKRELVEPEILRPFLTTGGLRAYQNIVPGAWLIFPYETKKGEAVLMSPERLQKDFPKTWNYLKSHEQKLRGRDRGKADHDQWYAFGRSQNLKEMAEEKLVIQVTAINPIVFPDLNGVCMTGGGAGPFYGIRPRDTNGINIKYLLGILNSKVFGWFVRSQSTPLRGGYFKYSKQYIETVPIPLPSGSVCGSIASLVEAMINLQRKLSESRTPQEKTVLDRQIAATGAQIDGLVYELYGLTSDEIAVVEGRAVDTPGSGVMAESRTELPPENAIADSAHFYSAKETPPTYNAN